MRELELKLGCLPTTITTFKDIPLLNGVPAEQKLLLNLYYDTPEESLKSLKIALRVRKSGEQWLQTLKTAGTTDASGLSNRGELEWPLAGPNLDLELLRPNLPETVDVEQLYPVFSTNFKRTTWLVNRDESVVEIARDQGEVRTGNRIEPISEIELELKAGDASALLTLATEIAGEIPVWIGQRSKAQRGQELKFEHPPVPELPNLVVDKPDTESIKRLAGELTITWQRCFELLLVTQSPKVTTALCSAIERLISVLRQLGEPTQDLVASYEKLLMKLLPLMDTAYFSGSDPVWYRTIQDKHKLLVSELLADQEIGKLALNTAGFLLRGE